MDDLPKLLFEGIKNAEVISKNDYRSVTNSATSVSIDANHNLSIEQDPNDSTKYYFSKEMPELQFFDGVLYSEINPIENYNGFLTIHHGPKANQASHFFLNDMHTKSLGTEKRLLNAFGMPKSESDLARYEALSYDKDKQAAWLETLNWAQDKTLDDISVTTQKNANIAIRVIDGAIDYALDQATQIGSYLQRLEYTDANVVTMGENVQASESAIRDADMAKEMTEYTKNNVLLQASQSMLAQANQNGSAVLSLLQ